MMGKHELREEWDGYTGPAAAAAKPAAKEPVKAEDLPDEAAETVEAAAEEEKNDPAQLKDLTRQSIAETFRHLAAQAREDKEIFAPTLAALNALVSKCQDAGLNQIGLEQAGFDTLRELGLLKEGGSERPPLAHYALLSIDDARILVRVLPDNIIDCYNENINKPRGQPRYLDSKAFWSGSDNDGKGLFRRFDLSKDDDQIDFVQTLIITAAATGALQELRRFDTPAAQNDAKLRKPQRSVFKPK
ncbi:MAG: hypothetical protein Q8K65_04265 [Alphaproteobacteria bacterium]|nr:hypothetical protein [Alphaproteobacteria bacterium]